MSYLVAYPRALRTFASRTEAEAFADTVREAQHVKIYEIKEVAHLFPSGNKGPPKDPGPPGTPTAAAADAAAAAATRAA